MSISKHTDDANWESVLQMSSLHCPNRRNRSFSFESEWIFSHSGGRTSYSLQSQITALQSTKKLPSTGRAISSFPTLKKVKKEIKWF